MNRYLLDYETTSAADIRRGAYRYASDPTTRILMFAISKNGGDPVLWDYLSPDSEESNNAWCLLNEAVETNSIISSFNVGFELAVSHYRLMKDVGIGCPSIEQLRCTRAMALRAAIPASLAKASKFLKLEEDKDARGKALISVFSDQSKLVLIRDTKVRRREQIAPDRRKVASPLLVNPIPWEWEITVAGEHITVRQAWDWFKEYCRRDVVVEGAVADALKRYELTGHELEGFQFDLRMNHRGAPVNMPALVHAEGMIQQHAERLTSEFREITSLMPSQTAKVLEWLKDQGYPGDNLQRATMDEWLGSTLMSDKARRALEIRAQLSFAAVKKIPTMIETACPDNRMRGLFRWHGAQRTGRWTSSGPQLQNAKRPTIKDPDSAYADIVAGVDLDTFAERHGNPYEAIASCVRNFLQPHDGRKMLDADYAGIELRLAGLMAGQDDMVQAFREGRDLYKELASIIFGVPVSSITKDQRFVGKTAYLACIYQVGARTFFNTCAMWGQEIPKKLAIKSVRVFREQNHRFPETWRSYHDAAINAMRHHNKWFHATPMVKFAYVNAKPFPRLVMRLPSGRDIVHPLPQVKTVVKETEDFETGEVREWEAEQISFYGQLKGSAKWGRVETYAGSLFQSSVQATARDLMVNGCVEAERRGFKIFSVIHDQALAEEGDPEEFAKALCTLPDWMPQDFPLVAESALVDFYKKD